MRMMISSEYSAQGTHSKPNPFVRPVLQGLTSDTHYGLSSRLRLVDLGCGKLRHLEICMEFAERLILVDTRKQIERVQRFGPMICTMVQYIEAIGGYEAPIEVITIDDFERQRHNADVILSVATMDVVPRETRVRIAHAAFVNLRPSGYFVVIVPRNDSSLLKNRNPGSRYEDGHILKNRGHDIFTFYANFRDPLPLLEIMTECGFELYEDHSVFRQICWILRKPSDA